MGTYIIFEKLIKMYKKIRQKRSGNKIENNLSGKISKRIVEDVKERKRKVGREKELDVLKTKINQITKLERELASLSPEEWRKVNELIDRGYTLEEAIRAIKNNRES